MGEPKWAFMEEHTRRCFVVGADSSYTLLLKHINADLVPKLQTKYDIVRTDLTELQLGYKED